MRSSVLAESRSSNLPIVIRPGVEVEAIKCDALAADSNGDNVRVPFAVESIFVDAEISRCVAETQVVPQADIDAHS